MLLDTQNRDNGDNLHCSPSIALSPTLSLALALVLSLPLAYLALAFIVHVHVGVTVCITISTTLHLAFSPSFSIATFSGYPHWIPAVRLIGKTQTEN